MRERKQRFHVYKEALSLRPGLRYLKNKCSHKRAEHTEEEEEVETRWSACSQYPPAEEEEENERRWSACSQYPPAEEEEDIERRWSACS